MNDDHNKTALRDDELTQNILTSRMRASLKIDQYAENNNQYPPRANHLQLNICTRGRPEKTLLH